MKIHFSLSHIRTCQRTSAYSQDYSTSRPQSIRFSSMERIFSCSQIIKLLFRFPKWTESFSSFNSFMIQWRRHSWIWVILWVWIWGVIYWIRRNSCGFLASPTQINTVSLRSPWKIGQRSCTYSVFLEVRRQSLHINLKIPISYRIVMMRVC